MSNTEQAHGHWSDRFTKEELAKLLLAMASKRGTNGNRPLFSTQALLRTAANVLASGTFLDANLADEVDDYAHQIALRTGAYDDAAILGDAADALREIEEEFATNMNLPLPPRHDGTPRDADGRCLTDDQIVDAMDRGVIAEDRKHASEQDRQPCEHGHPNCNPISDKCGDECD